MRSSMTRTLRTCGSILTLALVVAASGTTAGAATEHVLIRKTFGNYYHLESMPSAESKCQEGGTINPVTAAAFKAVQKYLEPLPSGHDPLTGPVVECTAELYRGMPQPQYCDVYKLGGCHCVAECP